MARIINEKPAKRISEIRRDLMLRVMDDQSDLAGAMHVFHHYTHCDSLLVFLIEHGFVGKALKRMIINEFKSNMPDLIDWIVIQINHKKMLERVTSARQAVPDMLLAPLTKGGKVESE